MIKKSNIFDGFRDEDIFCPQGNIYGIKALGFRSKSPNNEADELGLHKDGRSRRGVPPCFRPVSNSKRRGMKSIPKKHKRFSIRFAIEIQQSTPLGWDR